MACTCAADSYLKIFSYTVTIFRAVLVMHEPMLMQQQHESVLQRPNASSSSRLFVREHQARELRRNRSSGRRLLGLADGHLPPTTCKRKMGNMLWLARMTP